VGWNIFWLLSHRVEESILLLFGKLAKRKAGFGRSAKLIGKPENLPVAAFFG
jgi:hypothetical protein